MCASQLFGLFNINIIVVQVTRINIFISLAILLFSSNVRDGFYRICNLSKLLDRQCCSITRVVPLVLVGNTIYGKIKSGGCVSFLQRFLMMIESNGSCGFDAPFVLLIALFGNIMKHFLMMRTV